MEYSANVVSFTRTVVRTGLLAGRHRSCHRAAQLNLFREFNMAASCLASRPRQPRARISRVAAFGLRPLARRLLAGRRSADPSLWSKNCGKPLCNSTTPRVHNSTSPRLHVHEFALNNAGISFFFVAPCCSSSTRFFSFALYFSGSGSVSATQKIIAVAVKISAANCS